MEFLESLSHTKLLIILAICWLPALLQGLIQRQVHSLWVFVALFSTILVVGLW